MPYVLKIKYFGIGVKQIRKHKVKVVDILKGILTLKQIHFFKVNV